MYCFVECYEQQKNQARSYEKIKALEDLEVTFLEDRVCTSNSFRDAASFLSRVAGPIKYIFPFPYVMYLHKAEPTLGQTHFQKGNIQVTKI